MGFVTKKETSHCDYYVVFEIFTSWIRKTYIGISETQEWQLHSSETRKAPPMAPPRWYAETLRELAETRETVSRPNALFIFDRAVAHLSQQSVALQRADWNAEITAPELETMIRHGIWKSAQHERVVAGRFLGVHELQVRLADVDIVQMRVDMHRVVSPLGFRGHEFECLFRKVFVKADVWRWVTDSVPAEQIVAVSEQSGVWASWISALVRHEALFLHVGEKETTVYVLHDGAMTYRDTVAWGSDLFFAGVAAPFGLSAEWTHHLIERYAQGACSFRMGRAIEDALAEEFSTLLHAIDASRSHKAIPVFVKSLIPLPDLGSMPHLLQRLGESAQYQTVTFENLREGETPMVHYTRGTTPGPLTPSYETLYALISRVRRDDHHEVFMGKTARQRVRWTAEQG